MLENVWSQSWCPHEKYHFLYPKFSISPSRCSRAQVKPYIGLIYIKNATFSYHWCLWNVWGSSFVSGGHSHSIRPRMAHNFLKCPQEKMGNPRSSVELKKSNYIIRLFSGPLHRPLPKPLHIGLREWPPETKLLPHTFQGHQLYEKVAFFIWIKPI